MRLVDLLDGVALRHASRTFLTWGEGRAVTYGDVAAVVDRQAEALRAAGLQGCLVLLITRNRPELVTLWMAGQRAGTTMVFVNPALTGTEVARIAGDLQPALVVGEHPASDVTLDEEPGLRVVAIPEVGPAPAVAIPDGTAAVVLTSGSTGHPKYVAVPHAAYVGKGTLNALRLGWSPDDRAHCVMPLFHVGAQCETLAPAIASGASVHLAATFSSGALWDDLARLGITHLHATGSLLAMALTRGDPPPGLELRRVVASLRGDVAEPLAAALPQADLITLYGLTECPLGTLSAPGESFRPGWVGHPYLGWGGLRIVDGLGRRVGDGEAGEIQLRNVACTPGYLAATAESPFTGDGWLRTGDVGRRAGGGLLLTGRIKEMIRRSGENIAPAEVEDAALRHPAVVEAAALPFADPVRDEEVWLCVEAAGAVDPGQLRDLMARELAGFKLPRYIDVLASLPRTASNKVDKAALAATRDAPAWDAEAARGESA
jgi:acyl-CoA synthetase (AMP-forming)/AMP-acid ligase II